MKVLHIAETLKGGPASHLEELLPKQIREFGANNVKLLVSSAHAEDITGPATECVETKGIWSRSAFGLARMGTDALSVIKDFHPDVVHLHSTFAGGVVRLFAAGTRAGAKFVYCPHGWSFAMEIPEWKKRIYSSIERVLSHRTSAIITVSDYERDLAAARGFSTDKLKVVYNGIADTPPILSRKLEWDRNKLNLLFIGRLDRQKGVDYLIETAAKLTGRPIHFHVVGGRVQSPHEPKWEEGDYENVTFYGWTPRADVFSFIAECDALVMPSRWEGMPITALEAMRQKKPIVGSNRSSLPELVTHRKNGLIFDLDDPQSLAKLLPTLTKSDLMKMGDDAHREFLNKYTSDMQFHKLNEIYTDLVGKSS